MSLVTFESQRLWFERMLLLVNGALWITTQRLNIHINYTYLIWWVFFFCVILSFFESRLRLNWMSLNNWFQQFLEELELQLFGCLLGLFKCHSFSRLEYSRCNLYANLHDISNCFSSNISYAIAYVERFQ